MKRGKLSFFPIVFAWLLETREEEEMRTDRFTGLKRGTKGAYERSSRGAAFVWAPIGDWEILEMRGHWRIYVFFLIL